MTTDGLGAHFAHHGVPSSPRSGAWTAVSADGKNVNLLEGASSPHAVVGAVRGEETAAWKA